MLKPRTITFSRRVHISGDLKMTALMHQVSHYDTSKIKKQQTFATLKILGKTDFTFSH